MRVRILFMFVLLFLTGCGSAPDLKPAWKSEFNWTVAGLEFSTDGSRLLFSGRRHWEVHHTDHGSQVGKSIVGSQARLLGQEDYVGSVYRADSGSPTWMVVSYREAKPLLEISKSVRGNFRVDCTDSQAVVAFNPGRQSRCEIDLVDSEKLEIVWSKVLNDSAAEVRVNSKQGQVLATLGFEVSVLDLKSGNVVQRLTRREEHGGLMLPHFVALSPSGEIALVPWDFEHDVELVAYSTKDWSELWTVPLDGESRMQVEFDSQGRRCVIVNQDIQVRNPKTGKLKSRFEANHRQYRLSPDGRYLLALDGKETHLLNSNNGKSLMELPHSQGGTFHQSSLALWGGGDRDGWVELWRPGGQDGIDRALVEALPTE